ncbi:hypothetical protein QQP08_016560 [Theobroma cacao]|nr:hypothetical protein QQP08_016560 [Theobroma cacao]
MERVAKMLLISILVLVVLASNAEGRRLKEEEVDHPQNFLGGFGTSGGFVPTPGGGVGFGLGPSVFCAFPGTGCVRVQPTIPGGTTGTGTGTGTGTPP